MADTHSLQELLDESSDKENPSAEELKAIMESVRTIAVVGISRNPEKAARRVPSYLASKGYEIFPVNPFVDQILGREAADSLSDLEEPVDMVVVFRPSDEAAGIADEAASRKEKPVIWLQKEIVANDAARRARDKGLQVVQDMCTYEVHKALNPS